MKKVLFVATVVKTHIMEFHIPYLKLLKEMGWETAVAARNDYDNELDCNIPYCDHYYDICFERSPVHINNALAYLKLKKVIEHGSFDVVHCHTPVGAGITRIVAKNMHQRKPVIIYTAHGFHFYKGAPVFNWAVFFPIERWLSKYTDIIVTINQEDYANALRFHRSKVVYSPGVGVNIKRFRDTIVDVSAVRNSLGLSNQTIIVLSVGEINNNKNQETVIKALARIDNQNIVYVICGQGKNRKKCEQLAKKMGLREKVIFTGYRTDTEKLYKSADIFVFPSRREGLGLAAIEAMAAGLPLITTNSGGIKEYSVDGLTGIVVSPDDEEQIAQAIKKLSMEPQLRLRMGMTNISIAEQFDINLALKVFRSIYEGVE